MTSRTFSVLLAACLVFGAVLTATPASFAANEVTRFAAGPIPPTVHCNPNLLRSDLATSAAGRPDYCVAFYADGGQPSSGDDTKTSIVSTPVGFAAAADGSPQCSHSDFDQPSGNPSRCPAETQVGIAEADIRIDLLGFVIAQHVQAKVWNLEHSEHEVAMQGLELMPALGGVDMPRSKLIGRVTLSPAPNVALRTVFDNQPRTADLGSLLGRQPLAIDGLFVRLWGSKLAHPSMPNSFVLLGSDCGPDQTVGISLVSYRGEETHATSSHRLTDCASAPFGATASVTTSERRPDVPTQATITVELPENLDPRVTANMKKVEIQLPPGLELGAQLASGATGLPLCSSQAFGYATSTPASCPAAARIGDVQIDTPLQARPLTGGAFLGPQPNAHGLPAMYIEAAFGNSSEAQRIKLIGHLSVAADGRITTVVDDIPQLLVRRITVTLNGGAHAVLSTPRTCGTTFGTSAVTPASTGVAITADVPLTIDRDCAGAGGFAPTLTVGGIRSQAGARTPTRITAARQDRQERISRTEINLPAGLLADLKLATECRVEDAAPGACPESSRVGQITATAGVGPAPYPFQGDVFLTEPPAGAVAGAVIDVPVRFGDVDLGTMRVPARMELRDGDFGLRLIADMPPRYEGLALALRSLEVDLDRPSFSINPTTCDPLTTTSRLVADTGAVADVPSTFQATGCGQLDFDPSLGFQIIGRGGQGDKPALVIRVGLAPSGSNMKLARVTLPPGLGADLTQIARACPLAEWDSGTCSERAAIGTLTAQIAITDELIHGTLSMVTVPGQTLPSIGMQLLGRFASRIRGRIEIAKAGQLVTSFAALPDVPMTALTLNLAGGSGGALISTKALCATTGVELIGTFTAFSGPVVQRKATTTCSGVKTLSVVASGRVGSTVRLLLTPPYGREFAGATLQLPRGVSIAPSSVDSRGRFLKTKTVSIRGRTMNVAVPKAGAAMAVRATIPRRALVIHGKPQRRAVKVSVRARYTNGSQEAASATLPGKR